MKKILIFTSLCTIFSACNRNNCCAPACCPQPCPPTTICPDACTPPPPREYYDSENGPATQGPYVAPGSNYQPGTPNTNNTVPVDRRTKRTMRQGATQQPVTPMQQQGVYSDDGQDYYNSSSPTDDYGQDPAQEDPNMQLTMRVKRAIISDGSISPRARMVNVQSSNGVVTLSGTVATMDEANRMEKIARSVPGVEDVVNLLQVRQ